VRQPASATTAFFSEYRLKGEWKSTGNLAKANGLRKLAYRKWSMKLDFKRDSMRWVIHRETSLIRAMFRKCAFSYLCDCHHSATATEIAQTRYMYESKLRLK